MTYKFTISRDDWNKGPHVPLCDSCANNVMAGQIWHKIGKRRKRRLRLPHWLRPL